MEREIGPRIRNLSRETPKSRFPIFVILFIAFLLRVYALGASSFWADEAYTLWVAQMPASQILTHTITQDFNPPLIYLLYHGIYLIFPWIVHEASARLFMVCIDITAIYMAYHAVTERIHWKSGLWTALLMALSPFEVEACRTARPYVLMLLLALLCFHYADRYFHSRNVRDFLISCLALLFALYTHYYAFFFFLVLFLFALFRQRFFTFFLYLLTFLFYLPWIPVFIHHLSKGNPMIQPLSLFRVIRSIFALFLGQIFFLQFPEIDLSEILLLLWILLFSAYLLISAYGSLRESKQNLQFFVLLAFFPIFGALVVSFFIPGYEEFYFVMGLPGLMTLMATGLLRSRSRLLAFSLVLTFFVTLLPSYSYEHQSWREIVQIANQQTLSEDIVLANIAFDVYPILYYYHGKGRFQSIQEENFSSALLEKTLEGCRQIYLLGSFDPALPENRLRLRLLSRFPLQKRWVSKRVFLEIYSCLSGRNAINLKWKSETR